ncbi:MAG: DUF222 domain-containing protein, partial [Jatrophihabitans sp.]
TVGARSTAGLLRDACRVHPVEARARVRAALAAGPRRTLTGCPVEPQFPLVAAAQARGSITARHAQVIVKTIDTLPDAVRDEHGESAEATLVDNAELFDPHTLSVIAEHLLAHLDPDGRYRDIDYRDKHRDLVIRQRADGSGSITGELTAECTERLLTVLDSTARPMPEADGLKDQRSPGQRRHDGLLDALNLVQRAELIPDVGGCSTTVVITMSEEAWRTGAGTATTGHGAVLPAGAAIDAAGGDTKVLAVAVNSLGEITGYGHQHRIFTQTQRLAMAARDGGCSFPGCPTPASWCQAHHLTDYATGGPTSVNNGTLVCGHDHRERIRQGWTAHLMNGRVAWTPPSWIDPKQEPRFNTLHRPRLR